MLLTVILWLGNSYTYAAVFILSPSERSLRVSMGTTMTHRVELASLQACSQEHQQYPVSVLINLLASISQHLSSSAVLTFCSTWPVLRRVRDWANTHMHGENRCRFWPDWELDAPRDGIICMLMAVSWQVKINQVLLLVKQIKIDWLVFQHGVKVWLTAGAFLF